MAEQSLGPREFRSTYFALRVALIASALTVLATPYVVRLVSGDLPPSISDSWWTEGQSAFVVGLAGAGVLLAVIRGDTLTEQALLNISGGLALVVAAAACWPKGENGESLPSYPTATATANGFAIGMLLLLAVAVALVSLFLLPKEIIGTGWNARGWWHTLWSSLYPVLLGAAILLFLLQRHQVEVHAHAVAAVAMFSMLGAVALLRTTLGVRFLRNRGDVPVQQSLSALRLDDGDPVGESGRTDRVYAAVGFGIFAVIVLSATLHWAGVHGHGFTLAVETALLLLFIAFWITQTREGWAATKTSQWTPSA